MSNPKSISTRSLELDIKSLPLDFLRELFSNETPASLRSICITLVPMANAGRSDALPMLFGLAYLNRNDLGRMLIIAQSLRLLNHPEVVLFLQSEMLRVPSTPASRTYLRFILDSLFQIDTESSRKALRELLSEKRIGIKYRKQIEDFLYSC